MSDQIAGSEVVTIPPRPKPWHDPVARRAAETAAPAVAEWLGYAADERLITVLARALRGNNNGYEIAKALEGALLISPDAELVEILDGGWRYDAEAAAVKEWAATHNIGTPLPDGTMVNTPQGVGEIMGRDAERATYIVWNESCRSERKPRCGWVMDAEACKPVEPSAPDAEAA